ncbi:ArnT family glycosyltransferase [Spartinivicinus ruber]|uniref:ArnT family glycosyltransferase n=1 Tax=Spartinivicinus ruber TaxID=2683272 RepID=UPI0013D6B465|nr:glycosyltransferase family 39 protein [Spartinivicinus ruber]
MFIIAMVTRLSFVSTMTPAVSMGSDAYKYTMIAINLINRFQYHYDPASDKSISWIYPGYPLFLTAVMSLKPVNNNFVDNIKYVHSLLWGGICLLIYIITFRISNLISAVIAAMLTALSPHLVVISGYILTETWFSFLLILVLYLYALWLRKHSMTLLILMGLVAAAATLTRPVFMLAPLILFFMMGFFKTNEAQVDRRKQLILLIVFITALSPWYIWKHNSQQVKDQTSLLREAFHYGSYPNLSYGAGPRVSPRLSDSQYMKVSDDWQQVLIHVKNRAFKQPMEFIHWYVVDKFITYWQWDIIQGQGGPFIYQVNNSIYDYNLFHKKILKIFEEMHPLLIILAFIYATLILYRQAKFRLKETPLTLFIGIILFYYSAVHIVLTPLPRYALPLYPLIYMMASLALVKLGTTLINKFSKPYEKVNPY